MRRLSNGAIIALWVATLVAASAGAAGAASLVTGTMVKDGSLSGLDIRDGSIQLRDLALSARPRIQIDPGPIVRSRAIGQAGPDGGIATTCQIGVSRPR